MVAERRKDGDAVPGDKDPAMSHIPTDEELPEPAKAQVRRDVMLVVLTDHLDKQNGWQGTPEENGLAVNEVGQLAAELGVHLVYELPEGPIEVVIEYQKPHVSRMGEFVLRRMGRTPQVVARTTTWPRLTVSQPDPNTEGRDRPRKRPPGKWGG
jgi:hypothetical protein